MVVGRERVVVESEIVATHKSGKESVNVGSIKKGEGRRGLVEKDGTLVRKQASRVEEGKCVVGLIAGGKEGAVERRRGKRRH